MSRATRALWLLEELGLKYDTKLYFRNKQTHLAPPELQKVHPSGVSPLVEDDNGIVYAESGAIIDHFVSKYGKESDLIWKNEQEEATIKYALYAGESNIVISGFMLGVHGVAVQRAPWGLSALLRMAFQKIDSMYASIQFERNLKNLSDQLEKNGGFYCNGRFTVADIMYEVTLEQFLAFGLLKDLAEKYPTIAKWRKRLEEETQFLKVKEKEKQLESSDQLQSHL